MAAGARRCALVYGQMNEPPGARARVGLSGLTVAEYFRDARPGRAVLRRQHLPLHPGRLGSVGAARPHPLGGGLSADAATDMGALQERITTTKKGRSPGAGHLRAGRRLDRPGAATSFAHLDATTVLRRSIAEKGHLPGGRSARLDLAHARPARRRR